MWASGRFGVPSDITHFRVWANAMVQGMEKTEYLFTKLPQGVVPKTVGFEAVVSMELTELAEQGWRVISAQRHGPGFSPLEVVLERTTD